MSVSKNKHTYDEIVEALSKKTDPQILKQRRGKGNKTFTYLPHAHATAMLNAIFGFEAWSFEPLPDTLQQLADGSWIVFVRLTIHDHWGWGHDVVAVEVGHKEHNERAHMAIGDEIKSAVSLGLSRAAMRACGLAVEIWLENDDVFLSEGMMEKAKEDTSAQEPIPIEKDPLVKIAKKEMGATAKELTASSAQNVDVNTKVDWAAFYAWAEDEGFSKGQARAILAAKAGGAGRIVELTKAEMAKAIQEQKTQ